MERLSLKVLATSLVGAILFTAGCGGGGGGSSSANWVLFIDGNTLYQFNRSNSALEEVGSVVDGFLQSPSVDDDRSVISVVQQEGSAFETLVMNRGGDVSETFTGYKRAAVSPDGEKIALVRTDSQVFVADIDGSNLVNVFNGSAGGGVWDISWSPDGTKLLLSYVPSSFFQLAVVNSDGSSGATPTFLTANTANSSLGRFSPDGQSIVFMSERDGNQEIYIMDADGSDQTRLTNSSGEDTQPSFNRDGTKIYFQSFRNAKIDLYEMDLDGAGQTVIVDETNGESWPIAG